MRQLWKARQGRRAAIAVIAPLVARSAAAFGSIPGSAWHDAYVLGFISMLASIEASKKVGPLSSQALGLVQADTLAELSGEAAAILGEEICVFSVEEDPDFLEGCRNAMAFHRAVERAGRDAPPGEKVWFLDDDLDAELTAAWRDCFDLHVSDLP